MNLLLSISMLTFFISCKAVSQNRITGVWEDKKFKGEYLHFVNDSSVILKGQGISYEFRYKMNHPTNPSKIIFRPVFINNYPQNIFSSNEITGDIKFINDDEIFIEIKLFNESMFGENSKTSAYYIRLNDRN